MLQNKHINTALDKIAFTLCIKFGTNLHMCEDLVPILKMCEELVPIPNTREKIRTSPSHFKNYKNEKFEHKF